MASGCGGVVRLFKRVAIVGTISPRRVLIKPSIGGHFSHDHLASPTANQLAKVGRLITALNETSLKKK